MFILLYKWCICVCYLCGRVVSVCPAGGAYIYEISIRCIMYYVCIHYNRYEYRKCVHGYIYMCCMGDLVLSSRWAFVCLFVVITF